MPRQTTYHVFPADDLWRLRAEVHEETWRFYETKEAAIAAGTHLIANGERARIVVHDEAGRIELESP